MESRTLKSRLADSARVVWKEIVEIPFFVVAACFVLLATLTGGLRAMVIVCKQWRALKGLNENQRDLLKWLWEAEKECRRGGKVHRHGFLSVYPVHGSSIERVDALMKECRTAGIDEWRLARFSTTSYDYWWWALINTDRW